MNVLHTGPLTFLDCDIYLLEQLRKQLLKKASGPPVPWHIEKMCTFVSGKNKIQICDF